MKISPFSLGFLAVALAGCGDDKSLVVGDERRGSESVGGAGSAGAAGFGMGGASGGAGSGAGGTSGSDNGGNGPGPGPRPDFECMNMADEYRDKLMMALTCVPMEPDPCTLMMPDDLLCGCPTYVDWHWYREIDRLNQLIDQAKDCPRMCPQIACRPTSGGACMSDMNMDPPRARCFSLR